MRSRALLLVALAVGLAACEGGEPAKAPRAAAPTPGAATSPVAPGPSAAAAGASSAPTGTSAPSAARTEGSASAGTTTTARPFVPRPAGAYRYTTNGRTTFSFGGTTKMPPVTTLSVDPPRSGRQRSLRDLRDEDGNGRTTEMRLRYAPEGLRLEYLRTRATFGGITDDRKFEPDPPPIVLRTGTAPGDRTSFTLKGSGLTAHTVIDVLRREPIGIGGSTLTALVIRLHTTFSGDVSGEDTSTQWLRPADGLLLKERDVSDVQSGAVKVHTEYTAKLRSLSP